MLAGPVRASCHSADKQFQDGRQFGQGIGLGKRRTMPVMGAAHSPCFWDGRKDRAWSQALGPFEDVAEQFTSVEEVVEHYARVARGSPGPQRTGASWREAR
ncbi:cytochrome-c peroxidase [Variovorax ginsengisoli]|uniref:Cytochrome-c peroxidase n=1 Tax=Variovorax ginsengisoli TaxID=363844 RepID=A0ABT8SHK6_9BURK|nr:cytochrome-c peroxidase [Variovorax ginsengisoli]MDN8618673.1 cytochrome-c peroxidase [Variovorax ginsengisoli]MDO1537843.1 cytochrome-c peroxidase [Variovorax ginsengisoli]